MSRGNPGVYLFTGPVKTSIQCNINLKKNYFREQMFDDPMIDREIHIRKGVMKIYNKRESDFRNMVFSCDYL